MDERRIVFNSLRNALYVELTTRMERFSTVPVAILDVRSDLVYCSSSSRIYLESQPRVLLSELSPKLQVRIAMAVLEYDDTQ